MVGRALTASRLDAGTRTNPKIYDREFMHGVWDGLYARLGELDELQIVTGPGYLWHARYVAWAQRWAFDRAIARLGGVRGLRVLEVGCGAGRWSKRLRDLGASVTGVDYAEHAVEQARRRVQGVDFQVADLKRDDLGTARFDVVLSASVLEVLTPDEQEVALATIRRSLVPGGWLVAMEDLRDVRRKPGIRTLDGWRRTFERFGLRPVMVRGFEFDLPIRAPVPRRILEAVGRPPGPRAIRDSDLTPSGQAGPPRERPWDVLLHPRIVASYALEPLCREILPDGWATYGLFVLRVPPGDRAVIAGAEA